MNSFRRPSFFILSKMSTHPQSISFDTSHLPCELPPHGPLRRPLLQTVKGHIPPVNSKTQSPQVRHRYSLLPSSSVSLSTKLLQAGWTILSVASAIDCNPNPQAIIKRDEGFPFVSDSSSSTDLAF